jgi:hypothetical protein
VHARERERNAYNILVGKPEERDYDILSWMGENIKMDIRTRI